MKKIIYILLLSACWFNWLQAQTTDYEYIPFPTQGAVWSETYTPTEWNGYRLYETYSLNGEDTLMEGQLYKKLFVQADTVFFGGGRIALNPETVCIGGIREDENKRVYYKGYFSFRPEKPARGYNIYVNNELLLYDFSVNKGDTIENVNGAFWLGDKFLVYDVDTVLYGAQWRRKITIVQLAFPSDGSVVRGNSYWIEGVGHRGGLLFTSGQYPLNGMHSTLRCFKIDDELLYFEGDSPNCDPLSVEDKTALAEAVKVYPNPSRGTKVQIDFGTLQVVSAQIIDLNGRVCESSSIQDEASWQFSTQNYAQGLYFYKLLDAHGQTYWGKFVVSD